MSGIKQGGIVPKKRDSKVEFHWNHEVKNEIGIYLKSVIVHFNTEKAEALAPACIPTEPRDIALI